MFGKSAIVKCPLAHQSKIYFESPPKEFNFQCEVSPKPDNIQNSILIYDITETPLSIQITTKNKVGSSPVLPINPPLTAHRYLTGYGQEYGGIAVDIQNNGNTSLNIKYYDVIPWFLRVFFHTLEMSINGQPVDPLKAFLSYKLRPGEDHSIPSLLEFSLAMPPNSIASFHFQVEKAFLHWTEHPPAANRGFDVGAAVISAQINPQREVIAGSILFELNTDEEFQIYTENLLVSLPTPDFSMPYNVITLTGTVIALFFGSIFNTLIRRIRNLDKHKGDFVSNRPAARVFRRIMSLFE